MKRFSRLFRRSKTLANVNSEEKVSESEVQVTDLHPAVQLRLKAETVPSFRAALNAEVDSSGSVLGLEDLKKQWTEVSADLSAASLGKRLLFLQRLHAAILKHFARLAMPFALVQLLLVTTQDKWIQFTTQSCFAEINPFAAASVGETLREFIQSFCPLLELIEYCIAHESSCLLLHDSALSVFQELIDVLTRSLDTLSSCEDKEVVADFVRLLYHALHCVYALAEMCKSHSAYISEAAQSFADLSVRLQRLLETLLCDIYLQEVSEAQHPFFERDVSVILRLFHFKATVQPDLIFVLLNFNCMLARKSLDTEGRLSSLVLRFLLPVVLTTLRKHKLSPACGAEVETALEKSLLCLQVVRDAADKKPGHFVTLVQERSVKLNDLIYYHAWYYLARRQWSACASFAADQSQLGRLYSLLFDLLCGDDKELPVSIFLTLLELDLVEKCKDAPPVIQTYTLELVTSYLVSTGTSSQAHMLESCVLDLVLSPLFFTGSAEPLLERCNEYITTILRVIKERPGGKDVLLKSLCTSVRLYKEFPIYLSKMSELISSLTSERDEEMVRALLSTNTAGQLFDTLQGAQEGVPAASVECLKVIAVKLLNISEVAEQVLHTPELLQRLMEDLVRLPHLTEFYIHCVSCLMKFHPEDELFIGFLQALRQTEAPALMRSLLQGLEQALSGNRRTVAECQARLISAGVFDVLLHTLEKEGDLYTVVLSVFRAVLHKSKVSRKNLTKDQLAKMGELLRVQLSHARTGSFSEGATDMLDNLLFIMFDSTELQQTHLFVRLPEFLGLTLDLLIDFPSQGAKIEYLRLVRKATEASVKSNPSLAHTHAIGALLSGMERCSEVETVRELSSLFICLATHHLDPLDLAAALRFLNRTTHEVSGPGMTVLQCLSASCQKSIDTFVGVDEKNKEYEVLDGTSQCAFLFSGKETTFSVVPADTRNSLFTHNKSFSGFAWVKPEANDQFPLQCVFVLLCKDKSASLHVTSSGSLHFMYLSDSHIVYEALTETEKLIFNKWNFVAISYQKGKRLSKRTEFALFINGRKCQFQGAGSLKFPKTMFSELQIGNREGCDCLKGLISYMFFLSQPLTLAEVQQLFKLGVSYPGCFQTADVCHELWHADSPLDLHGSLVLGVSPRMHDGAGTPLPLTVLAASDKTPLDPLSKRRLQTNHVHVRCKGVKPVLTTKFISASHAVGGLVSFLPLLQRANGAYISETLKLFSAFCSVPNRLTHRQVLGGFCDLLEAVLLEAHFEESAAIDVIQMVDTLQWSPVAQSRALETLLLRYRIWSRVSWDTQRIILLNLFRLLSSHCREQSTRKRTLQRALGLLAANFSSLRQNVGSEVLKSRRLEVMELVRNELMDTVLSESDVAVVLSHLVCEAKTSIDNAAAFFWLLRDLINCRLLKLSETVRSDIILSLVYVLARASRRGNSQLQAEAIVLLRLVYGMEPAEEEVVDTRKSRSISVTECPVTTEESVVSAFDEILPDRLTVDVYKALLGFVLLVPEDYAGKFLFEELLEENNGLKHKSLLLSIAKRLLTADLEVISDFSQLCYHLATLCDRDEFPGWLLLHLRNLSQQSAECERRIMDLAGVIFCKATLCMRNGCAKLRSLVHTLAVSSADDSQTRVLQVMSAVCSRLDGELQQTDISGLGQKVFHNIHDLVYVLEDALHLQPALAAHAAYLPLVKQILDLCARLNLLLSTYPNLTLMSYSVLQRLHCSEVQEQVDWTLQRKREGGMLRVLLKLLLLALHNCSSDKLQLVLHYLHFVLAGGSAEGLMCSTVTRTNKVQTYQMLSDYVEERLCRVLDGFPETEDDILYSEKFLLLYVFVECSEQLMERVEKQLDATPLARFLCSLLKHNKLSHHINLSITKESAQSRQEYFEFLRVCGDRIRTTARQFYYRREQLQVSAALVHYRRSFGSEAELADLEVERKTFIRKALKLMQTLHGARDSVEQLYSALSNPEYQTTLHLYLVIETSMKVGVVDHVLSALPPPELIDLNCTQGLDSAQAVLKETKKRQQVFRAKTERRHKKLRMETEYQRAYFRRQLERKRKQLAGICGLWETPAKPTQFWKLDRTQDALQRSVFLKADPKGSFHEEAVNKKYQQTDRRKRSFTDSIDDMEEERKLLRSFSRLPSDAGEEQQAAPSPVARVPEGFMFVDDQSIPCERIFVKGSHYGVLELTRNFVVFRSDGSLKPAAQFFGSALEWTAIRRPCEKLWAYAELREVFARRFNHQHTALEFTTAAGRSMLFNCFTKEAREEVLRTLQQKSPARVWLNPAQDFAGEGFTQKWRAGKMSNFEYLVRVNQFASRSFNDLNQYPVFPWVLSDYSAAALDLSDPKVYRELGVPIGALDPNSKKEAKRRYKHWEHDDVIRPFHYGSHYCTASIVLHYLVRLEPFATQAIALQDGHFDVADRLFSSIENAWVGSLKNSGDYKELVPEFFFLPEFLLNLNYYNFGTKQSGEPVREVQLPPWAHDVYEFVLIHRAALESRVMSEGLNRWIDLIFGYKQQGPEAEKAANVFFYITYESNCKAFFTDDVAKDAIAEGIAEQIAQYGQTPVQLFRDPHPRRSESLKQMTLMQKVATPSGKLYQTLLTALDEQVACFFAAKSRLLFITFSGVAKVRTWRGEATRDADIRLENVVPKTACCGSECQYALSGGLLCSCGYTDGSFKVHEVESGRLLASVWFHSGHVTCLCADNGRLLTAGDDASLALWNLQPKTTDFSESPICIFAGHKTAVKQCTMKTDLAIAASVDQAGEALVYSLNRAEVRLRLLEHGAEAVCLTELGWTCVCTAEGSLLAFSTCGVVIWRIEIGAQVCPQLQTSSSSEFIVTSSRRGLVITRLFQRNPVEEKWRLEEANMKCVRFAVSEQCLLALEEDNSLFMIDASLTR